ncbi:MULTISPECIES: hypothetical protein [Priestia]|uniref:hypothetical protein n=1 Tax=Priestia TaxID=2800373 RepID=UPI001293F431|nr:MULTISPECIES: hypothetical protein [Priestia]MED4003637.1 hypothetical protein [Priestia aryabhattai]MQR85359.1 hypothetical protein [Priestia megaterium]
MLRNTLSKKLADSVGKRAFIALDNLPYEGIISAVSGNLLTILQTSGYGVTTSVYISIPSINFVRVTPTCN